MLKLTYSAASELTLSSDNQLTITTDLNLRINVDSSILKPNLLGFFSAPCDLKIYVKKPH